MPVQALPAAVQPSIAKLEALGWYAREVLRIERLFGRVTVKRRRNPARPVRRRRSAFRDPVICYHFLAMAWLGATRLSHIEPLLAPRPALARALGLPRFCDHTTAHNFLNAFRVSHLRQLDEANARLLREHGSVLSQRAPVLDLDAGERRVRRAGRRRDHVYRWAVVFSAGEAVAQELARNPADWLPVARAALDSARERLSAKPRLVRAAGPCVSHDLIRALVRERLAYAAVAPWGLVLPSHPARPGGRRWLVLEDGTRALDLGVALAPFTSRHWWRGVLLEQPAPAPNARRRRVAIVTSLLAEPVEALPAIALSGCRIRRFFGHARWPLGDGKMPSGDARGNAAFLRLATMGMNVLRLFARQLGEGWTMARLHARLRAIAW